MRGNIPFVFFGDAQDIREPDGFVATIAHGISNRDMLFQQYQEALKFPVGFGRNWDALEDCLRDLSWIPSRSVLIVHEDLPSLDPEVLKMYLSLLVDCVLDWKPADEHELIVAFPKKREAEILRLIGSSNDNENHGTETE